MNVATTATVDTDDPTDPLAFHRLIEDRTTNGATTHVVYDAATRTRTFTSPLGRRSSQVLDAFGRTVELDVPGLAPTSLSYDERGRPAQVVQGSRQTTFAYDDSGSLESATDPAGRTLSLSYNASLLTETLTLPGGRTVGFAYDAANNLTALVPPGGESHGFDYAPADQLSDYSPPVVGPGETATHYTYDADGAPVAVDRPDSEDLVLAYDPVTGLLDSATSPDASRVYRFDPATGALAGVDGPGNQHVDVLHDGPLPVERSWSGDISGTVSSTYDANFRLASERVNDLGAVAYAYDGDGLMTSAGGLTLHRDAGAHVVPRREHRPVTGVMGVGSTALGLDPSPRLA